jgi:multidrug transporter EmrE-like cation transporter
MNTHAWIWLTLSVLLEGAADYLLKLSGLKDSRTYFFWAFAAYVATMLTWMAAVYSANAIAIPGAIWLLCGLILTTFIGIWFGEALSTREWWGIILAFVAVIFLCV